MSLNLNLKDVKEAGYSLLPAGEYNVIVDNAELKSTKAGDGEYISVKYKVLDGSFEGRFLFNMFNIKNPNPKTVEIGLSQLKAFTRIAGIGDVINNVVDIVGYKAIAIVKQKSDDYGDKNVISYFKEYKKPSITDPKNADVPFDFK